ncbi:hypothetical protein [Streptacidiphilus pinicola]|uniref:hypothetical protein n=1 Tax=Streptacidiphilus pinicola TaxID=2219663 RepID=UPI001402CDAE|nr:hypothetical protein [Streptacidiphilus pinicola]
MFEYQFIVSRTNELIAQAEHERLVREVRRANKARRESDRRRPRGRASSSAGALNAC